MAKKKKKASSKSTLESSTSSTQVISTPSRQQQTTEPPIEICEYLELKLRRPANKASSNKLRPDSAPKVSLHGNDARDLNLQDKDEVLICFRGQDKSTAAMAGALICQLEIPTLTTLRSPGSSDKAQNSITLGTCQISPSSAVDNIILESEEKDGSHTPRTPLAAASTPVSSFKTPASTIAVAQSTPQSGFSFASGGGGDIYTSPSSAKSSPTKIRNVANTTLPVWIFPLSAPLGEDVASILCQKAVQLHIQVEDPSVAARLSVYKKILKTLFMIHSRGRHYHEGDKVTISFQGKPLELQLLSIKGTVEANARNQSLLELEMESMSLKDDEEPPEMEVQIWKTIGAALEEPCQARRVLLYKICQDTTITFIDNILSASNELLEAEDSPSHEESPKIVVAGLSSTLERLRSLLLTPLLKPEVFSSGSLKAPRGVLLYGSSGVGKSCLARQLASDLEREQEANIRVEFVSCASLQSYSAQVGEAERRLSQIFKKASRLQNHFGVDKKSGTLVVLDDIHLICPKRSGYNPGADRVAATLLGLMDGIGSASSMASKNDSVEGAISCSIVILGITNNPSLLDPGLRRAGRLDFEVEVPSPDEASTRAEILKFQLDTLGSGILCPEFTEDQLLSLGKLAKGFNGADCMLSVKEALRIALLRQHSEEKSDASDAQITLGDLKHAIRATKPSAIKSITVEIPKVHWSSIGGMETVKRELREAIELPMSHGHLFQQLNIPPPRGILLYGPPGCSKTLMARALATEGQMNFLAVKGPELLSKWLGESERALASLFQRARMASPSIIFFDEIDSIGSKRGSGGIGTGGGRLLSQLLTELDGVNHTGGISTGSSNKKNPRVVIVGATNRPDLLDTALVRAGRIDRKIYVGVPDLQSRAQIFKIGLEGKACADDVDISVLAEDVISGGFSGAELIAACRDAALLALEEDESAESAQGGPVIQMKHLLKAISSTQRQISPEMIEFYDSFRKAQD